MRMKCVNINDLFEGTIPVFVWRTARKAAVRMSVTTVVVSSPTVRCPLVPLLALRASSLYDVLNSMLLSLFGEASSLPANQHITHLLYSATVHCSVGKMPSLTLSGTSASPYFSQTHSYIMLSPKSTHSQGFFPLVLFRPKLSMQLSFLVRVVLHGSSKFSWFD